jgi:L-aminopeptidase/D-esterase-like protein
VLTDVAGVRVGHWTDPVARTGCTVVVFPERTVASGEVRGGAPATREFALLDPQRLVHHVDAVVLSGGSAFGLAAADGVVRGLAELGRGFPTGGGPVPIVVGMSLFDLLQGDATVRPGPAQGVSALAEALAAPPVARDHQGDDGRPAPVAPELVVTALGGVGAGTGATVGKWRGPDRVRPGGLGAATIRHHGIVVSALVAVNAFGDIDPGGRGAALEDLPVDPRTGAIGLFGAGEARASFGAEGTNTTIGVVATNAALDKAGCLLVAQGAHDAFARALFPPHTRVDGDAVVAAATGAVEADADLVRLLGLRAVEAAIRSLSA